MQRLNSGHPVILRDTSRHAGRSAAVVDVAGPYLVVRLRSGPATGWKTLVPRDGVAAVQSGHGIAPWRYRVHEEVR